MSKYSMDDVTSKWPNRNIILMGGTGSGKSTIGRQLAKLIGLGFFDLDEAIERDSKQTVSRIFESRGEDAFRELELGMLRDISNLKCHVIAVGAGALLTQSSLQLAKSYGPIVWIQSNGIEVARRLFKRINEIEKRPLFSDLVGEESNDRRLSLIQERVQRMLSERAQWYSQADVVLDGSYVTSELAAQHLKDILLSEGLIDSEKNRFASWHRKMRSPDV